MLFEKAVSVGIDLQTLSRCSEALKGDYIMHSQELPPDTLTLVEAIKELTIKFENLSNENSVIQSHVLSSPPPKPTMKFGLGDGELISSVSVGGAMTSVQRNLNFMLMSASKITGGGMKVPASSAGSSKKYTIFQTLVYFYKEKRFQHATSKQNMKYWDVPHTLPASQKRANRGLISFCMTDD